MSISWAAWQILRVHYYMQFINKPNWQYIPNCEIHGDILVDIIIFVNFFQEMP